jgi:oligosaccharide reducing-end xylanase
MALFFAAGRWGNGKDIYNYEAQAQTILNSMLDKAETSDDNTTISNIFNIKEKQIVFVPLGTSDDFTDPSYHTPHFYELWGYWADKNKNFWHDVASTSREFLQKAAHPGTGLTPDYANFDGTPIDPWKKGNGNFQYDAWRVAMNIGLDYEWFSKDNRQIDHINKLLNFFEKKGIRTHGSKFTLDGKTLSINHNPGLLAMNAAGCLASTNKNRKDFLRELWNTAIPIDEGRYFDGLLYMLGMLAASGNFRIYDPNL